MKINYNDISLSNYQKARYVVTIEQNQYIPSNDILRTKLYPKQIHALSYVNPDPDDITRKLIGGSAFSGKSFYGASSALQDFNTPGYRCLILRRTYDDVIATGGIVDYLDKWLSPYYVENGGHIVHNESKKVFINTLNDAKIFYNYMMYLKDRKKFKSRGYHKIIVDEASELLKENLQFLNRSARDADGTGIPIVIEYISNPDASSGIEFLNDTFVKGPLPYFEMNFWDNLFINIKKYYNTLRFLSKSDFQFQMGNWDYMPQTGDIYDLDMIIAATLTPKRYQNFLEEHTPIRLIRTWDIAASENKTSSYTACSLFEIFRYGVGILKEQISFKLMPGRLEPKIHEIMGRDMDEGIEQFIEFQPAAAGKILAYDWSKEYADYNPQFVRVFKNKVMRAGKVVPLLKNAGLKNPLQDIPRLYFLENPLNPFMKKLKAQMVNFPNDSIDETVDDMEQFANDRIDNLSLFTQIITTKERVIRTNRG
jgi:phage terminase large subunit-like protein